MKLSLAPVEVDALKEFEGQSHDWIVVTITSHASDSDQQRVAAFAKLLDRGLLQLKNEVDHMPGGIMPKTKDGRFVTSEKTYRITAFGSDYVSSLGLSGWFARQFSSLADNVVTIVIAVVTALSVAWGMELGGPTSFDQNGLLTQSTQLPEDDQ